MLHYKPQVILTTFENFYVLSPDVKYVFVTGDRIIKKNLIAKGLDLLFFDEKFKKIAVYVKQDHEANLKVSSNLIVFAQLNSNTKFSFFDKKIMINNRTFFEVTLNFPYHYDVVVKSEDVEIKVLQQTGGSYILPGSEVDENLFGKEIYFETAVRNKGDFNGIKSYKVIFGMHDIYVNKLNEIMMISNEVLSQDPLEYLNHIQLEFCRYYEVEFLINTINSNTFYIKFLKTMTLTKIPCLIRVTFKGSEFYYDVPFDYQSFFIEPAINKNAYLVPLIGSLFLNAEKKQANNLKKFVDLTIHKKKHKTLVYAVTNSNYPNVFFPTDLSLAGCSIFINVDNLNTSVSFHGIPKKEFGSNIAVYFTYVLPSSLLKIKGTYSLYALCFSNYIFSATLPQIENKIVYNMFVDESYFFQVRLINARNKTLYLKFKCESIPGNPLNFILFQKFQRGLSTGVEVKITNSESFYCFVEFDYISRRYIPHLFISSTYDFRTKKIPRIISFRDEEYSLLRFLGLRFNLTEWPSAVLTCESSLANDELNLGNVCQFNTSYTPLQLSVRVEITNGPLLFYDIIYIVENFAVFFPTIPKEVSKTASQSVTSMISWGRRPKKKTTEPSVAPRLCSSLLSGLISIRGFGVVVVGTWRFYGL